MGFFRTRATGKPEGDADEHGRENDHRRRGAAARGAALRCTDAGGHVEPDIAGEPGRDHRAFVVEEGKAFVIAGRVGCQNAVIARQHLLQSLKAAQVGLDLLQGDDVEPLADIGDVLDCAIGMAVGELLDILRRNQQVLVQFTARDFVWMRIHDPHQRLAFGGDYFCTGRHRLAPRSGFRI